MLLVEKKRKITIEFYVESDSIDLKNNCIQTKHTKLKNENAFKDEVKIELPKDFKYNISVTENSLAI